MRESPGHGTTARRLGSKRRPPCLCDLCVNAHRRACKAAEVRRAQGLLGDTPTEPVALHIQFLVSRGCSYQGIAQESGVNRGTIGRIVNRRTPTIRTSTARKVMAVKPIPHPEAVVDATGTVRRLRSLVAMGHSQRTLADGVQCTYTYISMLTHGRKKKVTMRLAMSVERLYGALSMSVGTSEQGRRLAAKYGWHSALAWDDDTIDDPQAFPLTDAPAARYTEGVNVVDRFLMGESVVLNKVARRQVIAHLMEWTSLTPKEVGERMEMEADTVSRSWERSKARAREKGEPVPWRRAYVSLQDKDMTRTDMRSAA